MDGRCPRRWPCTLGWRAHRIGLLDRYGSPTKCKKVGSCDIYASTGQHCCWLIHSQLSDWMRWCFGKITLPFYKSTPTLGLSHWWKMVYTVLLQRQNIIIFIILFIFIIGGSKDGASPRLSSLGRIPFIFMQKKIKGWRSHLGGWHPCLGNPGSATVHSIEKCEDTRCGFRPSSDWVLFVSFLLRMHSGYFLSRKYYVENVYRCFITEICMLQDRDGPGVSVN